MKRASAFDQNTIAVIWDFDKTLITSYMQEPVFKHFGLSSADFWREVRALQEYYLKQGARINNETIYLNHFLTYIQHGLMPGLNNELLFQLGQNLEFYPGLPEFFPQLKQTIEQDPLFRTRDIKLEHYIVSTGFAAMIRGSAIAPYIDGVWGCEFIEAPAPPGFLEGKTTVNPLKQISQVALALDNTSKTRALFEINKGVNKARQIDVNSRMEESDRRIPFEYMLYIADGPSDVPAFSIINHQGGASYAVYPSGNIEAFRQVDGMRKDGRIQMFGEADYRMGSQTGIWITEHARQMAETIVKRREDLLETNVSRPPRHL
jgi:hypothetical protein